MSGTSSVPEPTFGQNGFIAPEEADILAGVQADMNAAFGGGLVFTTKSGSQTNPTPAGQLAASEAAIIGNKNDQFLYFCNMVDPAYAAGRMQDAIGRIYFIERNPAEPTVIQVVCTGLSGTVIPLGALVQASDGNTYACTEAGTIPTSGSVTLPFACTVTGPIACPAQTLTIYRTIPGWDTAITTEAGALGNVVENRTAFEARRAASVALNAKGSLPSVRAAVLAVPGVLDAYVDQNTTSAPVTKGGVTIAPHSIYACVLGGSADDIAAALWAKVAPGCDYTGNTSVTVQDTSYSAPYPTYTVSYEQPTLTPIAIVVSIATSALVPSDAGTQIQSAVVSAFAGGDGGARARIGGTLYASRYYAPVAALGAWAQIVSIQVGTVGGTLGNSVTLDIDQAPTIAASNVSLSLV